MQARMKKSFFKARALITKQRNYFNEKTPGQQKTDWRDKLSKRTVNVTRTTEEEAAGGGWGVVGWRKGIVVK